MSFVIPLLKDGEPLSRQIYLWFRQAIRRDEMKSNERLPSTRALAEHLDVSRTVVVLAYEQLLAEGFIRGRSGSGTYVAEGLGSVRPSLRLSIAASPPEYVGGTRWQNVATSATRCDREVHQPQSAAFGRV